MVDADSVGAKNLSIPLLGLVIVAGYLAMVALYWPQINDDAFITFRYSKFLELGRGPYFNIGEHVEGYTNFLMMLLMAGGIALFGDDEVLFVAKIINVGAGIAAILACWALAARWLRKLERLREYADQLAATAAALVAVNCAYGLNSTTGLETTLFSAAILIGLWLVQRGIDEQRYSYAGVAFALAVLTRPGGGLIFAAAFCGRMLALEWRTRPGRKALLLDAIIVVGVALAHLAFRYACYDGELLPNTYYAKAGGLGWRVSAAEYVWGFVFVIMGLLPLLIAFAPCVARKAAVRLQTLPALLVACTSVAAIFLTGAGWMPGFRLLMPAVPVWTALATCGIASLCDRLRNGALATAALASVVLTTGLLWWSNGARAEYFDYATIRAEGYVAGHAALADWINETGRPGDTIALMDIGIVGFKCIDFNVLDITGLTDRTIAKSPGGFLTKQFDPAYVFDQRPEFFIIAVSGPPGRITPENVDELHAWTEIEQNMLTHPIFRRHYVRPPTSRPEASELEWLAGLFGAERAFRHHYPAQSYLLFAYRWHEAEPASPAADKETAQ